VTTIATVTIVCVGATAFTSVSTALKHRSAGENPHTHPRGVRQLAGFVVETVRHPLWLLALVADAAGLGLQVTALHLGALAVVQPLMLTGLVFSLLVNHAVARTRVSKRETATSLLLVTALAGFLYVSGASSPRVAGVAQPADRAPAVAIAGAAIVLVALCLRAAQGVPRGRAAALRGVATGLVYAATAALIKSGSNVVVDRGLAALLTSWQLYAAIASGALGLLLGQLAFQAGPLRSSLPAIATVDPLASIVLGIVVYDEHLRHGPWALSGELACLAVLSAAAAYVSRLAPSEARATDGGDPAEVAEPRR
jgi:hypothetical protein